MNLNISKNISILAQRILPKIESNNRVKKIVKKRVNCPIDYMRYAEFSSMDNYLSLKEGDKVLDVSSPQWFTIYLANKYPKCTFYYLNIIDEELDPFKEISNLLELKNIQYIKGDCRELSFDSNYFDCAISISVIEHVFPEIGGDIKALNEINRVLKPNSSFILTVPLKEKRNIVYIDGDVYERKGNEKNFFAREYDIDMFNELVSSTPFELVKKEFICEKKGFMSLDYYQWGPGKETKHGKKLYLYRKRLEKLFGKNLEAKFAKKYLFTSDKIKYRVVNVAAELKKSAI